MFLLDFLRYCKGQVQFSAQGPFVERFLNLVARDRIPVWDGHKRGDTYTGYTDAASYKLLRRHARNAGVRLRVAKKEGAPFTRRKYRRRKGLLVGAVVFALFLFTMSLFIWRIEVNGNDNVSESEIISVLDRIGVRPGTFRPAIDVREAERQALLAMEDLSWIALNIDGSALYVEVNERVSPPENMVDPATPCNVVAAWTGQILSMDVYEGQAVVQLEETVLAGDVIVSGIVQDRRGQNLFRHARAKVVAQVERELVVSVPLEQVAYEMTGEVKERLYFQILSLDLPLYLPFQIPHPYHVDRTRTPWTVFGIGLPLSHLKEEYKLMQEVPVSLTEEEAKAEALRELKYVEQVEMAQAEVLERTLAGKIEDGAFVLTAKYVCTMDIATEKEIYLEDAGA